MICVNVSWLHKMGRFSFGYFLAPGVGELQIKTPQEAPILGQKQQFMSQTPRGTTFDARSRMGNSENTVWGTSCRFRFEEINFLNGKRFLWRVGSKRRHTDSRGRGWKWLFFLVWDHVTGGKIDLQGLSSSFVSLTICQDLILSGY